MIKYDFPPRNFALSTFLYDMPIQLLRLFTSWLIYVIANMCCVISSHIWASKTKIVRWCKKWINWHKGTMITRVCIKCCFTLNQVRLDLKFLEAARGTNKTISLKLMDTCSTCNGQGNEPGTKVSRCGYCGGSGMVCWLMGCITLLSLLGSLLILFHAGASSNWAICHAIYM